jgi:hypothetical protein
MNEQETLTSVAEFAIALAGFSGIVVALGKQPGRWAPADRDAASRTPSGAIRRTSEARHVPYVPPFVRDALARRRL